MRGVSSIYARGHRVRDAEQEQADAFDLRRRGWHMHNIAAIRPEDVLDDLDRQLIINVADNLYGKRAE